MAEPALEVRRIDSRPPGLAEAAQALWRFRDLLWILARRDLAVRYKQTALGVLWVLLQPLLMMALFTLFFGRLAGVPSDGLPYPVFVLCGLVPWQLFAFALTQSSNSLVENERLISKAGFPRILLPLATTLVGVVDFAVALALLLAAVAVLGLPLTAKLAFVPLLVAFALAAALAAGLWLSALNVEYRDVRYALPFVAQVALFASPVAYPSSLVPEAWRWLYGLNPMAGVIDGFRWAVGGGPAPDAGLLASSAAVTVAGLALATLYFERRERSFADTL